MPTNQPQHILFTNNKSHHYVNYPSYFYLLFTQLILHHNSHTINSIYFSRPPQPISSLVIPSILAPCPLHLTPYKQHTSIVLFLSSSQTSPPFPLTLPIFHIPTHTPSRSSGLHTYCKLNLHRPGCGVAPSFLW